MYIRPSRPFLSQINTSTASSVSPESNVSIYPKSVHLHANTHSKPLFFSVCYHAPRCVSPFDQLVRHETDSSWLYSLNSRRTIQAQSATVDVELQGSDLAFGFSVSESTADSPFTVAGCTVSGPSGTFGAGPLYVEDSGWLTRTR